MLISRSVLFIGDVVITIGTGLNKKVGKELDSIQLSIFSHRLVSPLAMSIFSSETDYICFRFMSIAEQMGKILQRTSISVNIKVLTWFDVCKLTADVSKIIHTNIANFQYSKYSSKLSVHIFVRA